MKKVLVLATAAFLVTGFAFATKTKRKMLKQKKHVAKTAKNVKKTKRKK
jgi:hypothetical protein